MTVDRGGLDYPIIVRDGFGRNLGKFISQTNQARAAWESFQKTTSGGSGPATATERLQRSAEQTQRSIEQLTQRSQRLAQETRQLTRQEDNRRKGIERLNREARRREVLEAAALRSQRREFVFQRQQASALRARVAAEERVTRLIDRRTQREQLNRVLQERGLATDKKIRQELGLLTTAEQRLAQVQRQRRSIFDGLRKAQREANSERLRQIRAETQALNILNRAQIKEARDAILRARGREDLIPGRRGVSPAADVEQTRTFLQRLSAQLLDTDNKANRVAFTFRRLFGILAAFTIARQAIAGFVNSIRTLVQASAEIERTELGIASILTSVAEIRDTSGQAVSAVEGLAIAQQEARRQTQLLRKDALATTATFEELVEAFQVGLAPGLRAGLDVDQVRVFTRQISLAAAAIGLEQRQLAEEIRSILSGTINLRQTRIAAALGITNDEIRQARQAGELFQFLQERFEGFDAAGSVAANTFSGLVGRVRDGFRLLLSQGGIDFFENLKDLLRESLDGIQQLNRETGEIELNPALLGVVQGISRGLSGVIDQVRVLRAEVSDTELVEFANLVGEAFTATARVLRLLTTGVVRGLRTAGALLSSVRATAQRIGRIFAINIDVAVFERLLVIFVQIATVASLISAAMFLIQLPLKGIIVALQTIATVLVAIRAAAAFIQAQAAGVLLITGPLVLAVLLLVASVGFLLFRLGLLDGVIDSISNKAKSLFASTKQGLESIVEDTIDKATAKFEGFIFSTSNSLDQIRDKVSEIFKAVQEISGTIDVEVRLNEDGFNFNSPFIRIAQELQKARSQEKVLRDEAEREAQASAERFFELQEQAIRNARQLRTAGFTTDLDIQQAQRLLRIEEERARNIEDLDGLIASLRENIEKPFETTGIELLLDTTREALREQAEIRKRESQELLEQLQTQRQQALIESSRGARNASLLRDYVRINGEITAINEQGERAVEGQLALQGALLSQAIARSRVELQNANNAVREEVARARAAELQSTELTIARARRDEASERLILARQSLAVANFEGALELEALEISRERTEAALRLTQAEISRLQALQKTNDLTDGQQDALRQALQFEQQLIESRDLLNEQIDQTNRRLENQTFLLQQQVELQEFARTNPISAAFVDGIAEAFAQATDLFTRFREIFISGTYELSRTIASLIVDAFDPSSEANIRERFALFLRNLAEQIIATFTQIAITLAILNALSGGLLGATAAGFANVALGRGFNEGGQVTRSSRPRRARRSLTHASAAGFNSGGVPSMMARPSNLHPSDTIPIWTAANEWVIRAKSAAKAGWDAMRVINEGRFDPSSLRAALGLAGGPARSGFVASARGPGFVDGGRVAAQTAAATAAPQKAPLGVSVIAPSREAMQRLLDNGGSQAMLETVSLQREAWRAALGV